MAMRLSQRGSFAFGRRGRAQALGRGFEGRSSGQGIGLESFEQDGLFVGQLDGVAEAHNGDLDGFGTAGNVEQAAAVAHAGAVAETTLAGRGGISRLGLGGGSRRGRVLSQRRGHGAKADRGSHQGQDGGGGNRLHGRSSFAWDIAGNRHDLKIGKASSSRPCERMKSWRGW
jgi:hypothetical protein